MSPPPGFAERVFEARTAAARRLWFAGAALFTAAAAITTILVLRQHPAPVDVSKNTPTPVLVPAPAPALAPPTTQAPPLVTVNPVPVVHKKIAILGLEPMHHVDLQFTTDLTEALRTRAKTGIGAYELAPNTNRELIDEKLLNNCDNEETGCMSAIGASLGADVIMYGRVELGGGGYAVTLKILDVNKKRLERSLTRTIPFPDHSDDAETRVRDALDIAPDAQRMYWDLTKP